MGARMERGAIDIVGGGGSWKIVRGGRGSGEGGGRGNGAGGGRLLKGGGGEDVLLEYGHKSVVVQRQETEEEDSGLKLIVAFSSASGFRDGCQ
ncbi:hypothetical protein AXG93_3292s1050 [Marchantia polymorpha subsp. ruderalis]|uniref:Uncharacterized protein n=1 Tax=Marchantia polymorpha subsp. ruderalis TaxID=1480154 RepID=A0A176VQK4_MARPO|nr:hypothetical protein AXG93_3292s1050 [Marchantia polymorpha subsp. ruderalis]